MTAITVETTVNAPIAHVWKVWNTPEDIMNWAFASDEWEAPASENDLRVGGRFKTTMAAKDKSSSFDFTGTYTNINGNELIEYTMDGDDARKVTIKFEDLGGTTKITETFDAENVYPEAAQKAGWQAILENFKKRAEATLPSLQ